MKSEWERYRGKHPQLRLQPHGGDNLSHLLMGLDAKLSLRYFNQYRKAADHFRAAAVLVELFGKSSGTWRASGWVHNAVADVVLADRKAAEHFIRAYWNLVEAEMPAQQQKAMEALSEFENDRKTWLRMAKAVISAHMIDPGNLDASDLERGARKSKWFPSTFAADDDCYPEGYAEELRNRSHRVLRAMSAVCIKAVCSKPLPSNEPHSKPVPLSAAAPLTATELLDRTIAALHNTSLSTAKLRAGMKK